jgi:hypothetical protein
VSAVQPSSVTSKLLVRVRRAEPTRRAGSAAAGVEPLAGVSIVVVKLACAKQRFSVRCQARPRVTQELRPGRLFVT